MIETPDRKKILLKFHLPIWVIYVLINFFIAVVEAHGKITPKIIRNCIVNYSLGITIFYLTFFFILPLYYNRRYKLFFAFLISLLLHNSIKYIIGSKLFPLIYQNFKFPYTYWEAFSSATWWWFQFVIYSSGYFMALKAIRFEKNLRISKEAIYSLEKNNHYLQTENLKLEYKFLRAQINPHFLYNVLGFFYNKVNTKDENAGRGIMLLTEMMRYSIREAEADDKVLLQEEIQAINNLLDLQKLRFEGSTHTAMYVAEGMDKLRIVPHVLVTLVENACKHGDLTHEDDPLKISAQLTDGWFVFTTVNRIRTATSVERTDGFGLENLATRLRLQYDDNQYFAYGKEGGYYKVTFKLKAAIMAEDDTGENLKMEDSNQSPITEKQIQWLPA
jgi:two-component system, LytTR family, sensor kinase